MGPFCIHCVRGTSRGEESLHTPVDLSRRDITRHQPHDACPGHCTDRSRTSQPIDGRGIHRGPDRRDGARCTGTRRLSVAWTVPRSDSAWSCCCRPPRSLRPFPDRSRLPAPTRASRALRSFRRSAGSTTVRIARGPWGLGCMPSVGFVPIRRQALRPGPQTRFSSLNRSEASDVSRRKPSSCRLCRPWLMP